MACPPAEAGLLQFAGKLLGIGGGGVKYSKTDMQNDMQDVKAGVAEANNNTAALQDVKAGVAEIQGNMLTMGDIKQVLSVELKALDNSFKQDISSGRDSVTNDSKMVLGLFASLCGLLSTIIGLLIKKNSTLNLKMVELLAKKDDYKRSYYDAEKKNAILLSKTSIKNDNPRAD